MREDRRRVRSRVLARDIDKGQTMRNQWIAPFAAILGALLTLAARAHTQEILIDDFEDGDDFGWTHKFGGPETFEVVDGAYRITNPIRAPVGSNGILNIASLDRSHEPSFSNGYFRARLRATTAGTTMGMVLRGDGNLNGPSRGYAFYFATGSSTIGIESWWRGDYRLFGEVFLSAIRPGEDWFFEAGAVGDDLSLKAWRAADPEPRDPQVRVSDPTYSAGNLLIVNAAFGHTAPIIVDGLWDDITFRPGIPADASAEATPTQGTAPLAVRLEAETTPECEDVRYEWTLPDGATLDGQAVDHVFTEPGRHIVTLRIESDNGCRASTSVIVVVEPLAGSLDPWQASVIGSPDFGIFGQATQVGNNTAFELFAGGDRLLGTSDDNGFVHRELDCDGVLVARIDEIESSMFGAQVGIGMRENLETGAAHASLVLEIQPAGGELRFLRRSLASESTRTASETSAIPLPLWLRLQRRGDVVSASWSADGSAWTDAGSAELPGLGPTLLAGVVAIGNEPSRAETTFLLLRARLSGVDLRCESAPVFRRGDTNGDGSLDLSDPVATFGHLFLGSAAPACPDAEDADDSGAIDLSDGIFTLGFLFRGTTEPPLPGPESCGPDEAADELGDCVYAACP
jgi:PKD repeat protein